MLKPIGTLLLLFPAYLVFAQPIPTYEEKYVWARSGILLHQTPDFQGEKITILPYGTLVTLVEYPFGFYGSNEFGGDFAEPAVTETEAFKHSDRTHKIWGSWAKVKAGDREGYLFTGYLSALKPFSSPTADDLNKIPTVAEGMASLKAYMQQGSGVLKSEPGRVIFGDGATENIDTIYAARTRWVFPETTPENGYLLANFFFALEARNRAPKDPQNFRLSGVSQEGMEFYYDRNGAIFILRLTFADGVVVLTSEWAGD